MYICVCRTLPASTYIYIYIYRNQPGTLFPLRSCKGSCFFTVMTRGYERKEGRN